MTGSLQTDLKRLALDSMHARFGATMRQEQLWQVPARYSDLEKEYEVVRSGPGGVIDLSSRARILVTGSEAIPFLNGLITNDMKTLEENRWMPAAFPSVQGRLLAAVRVIRMPDQNGSRFLIDTEPATHERLFQTIHSFTMAGDFRVEDLTANSVQISLQGPKAAGLLASVLEASIDEIAKDGLTEIKWRDRQVTVIRASHTAEDGFDLVVSREIGEALWQAVIDSGARAVGHDALEILRIEAGIPLYGRDMDDSNVVSETNLDDAVSYTKGCYVGQEIIARIKYRGHVAKKLRGLIVEDEQPPARGLTVYTSDGREVGRITSSTYSPSLKQAIALAYVRYEQAAPGTRLSLKASDKNNDVIVTTLPFVRGSWYE